ncbi:MAG TPA: glycosyltransferase [Patescibacteria group bacterium]|nr:glycosyltransferase [Patescibacteria group bacterium]
MKRNLLKKISVIVPVYNEEKVIPELIKRLNVALKSTKLAFELIFVDDNSTDGTEKLFSSKAKNVIYLKKKGKQGKAYSLIEGFEKASGDILVMIDGDLQYPPEVIPQMVAALNEADVVVANRKAYKDSIVRQFLSRSFRTLFGKGLFKLNTDIQSGLKVMRKEVFDMVKFTPRSPWTFDLEFLHKARNAGYLIQNFDIEFLKRKNGNSKVTIIKTSLEIGMNAFATRISRLHPVHFPPLKKGSMIGAGIGYNGRQYVTHTTMRHASSALKTFTPLQKLIIAWIVLNIVLGLFIAPLLTMQILIAGLSLIYFIDVLFNLYLIGKSLAVPSEILSSEKEIEELRDKDLPIYTILCPLYKESHIIPHFLEAIEKISWPKEKLDVILLLEEDDKVSVEAVGKMKLPSYVRTVVVPDSMPKTKPKACNYGLGFARGEYVVIYDAEDIPDPLQLKKAYLGFRKVSKDTICLQAKLNYYNPHQNLLTRFFTAEYSLWFDVTLTGLQSIETTIPLGGTSNHFKMGAIREVEGWDPFNVTEDADLGVRLFRKGYKTSIIESTTLEEANSSWRNWLRQRSRWIKGYMQTYLVHTRETDGVAGQGIHDLIFQLVIGGKIAFVLINPFLWLATISYFALYAYVGPQIEALYPSYVFYMAVFSLVFGNFLFLYYYMIGVAKKGQWELMKYVFLIPFYWIMISIAAFIAFYQLLFKPHYWEKTLHGLHLKPETEKAIQQAIIKNQRKIFGFTVPKVLTEKIKVLGEKKALYIGGLLLISSTMLANVLNFAFNLYLGRNLSLVDFGEVSLFVSLLYLISIPLGSFSSTISHNIAYLFGKKSKSYAQGYLKFIFTKSIFFGVLLTIIWTLMTPFLSKFFQIRSVAPLIIFAPLWFISVGGSNVSGYLAGTLSFGKKGLVLLSESLIRLVAAVLFVVLGFPDLVFLSILISITISVIFSWFLIDYTRVEDIEAADKKFNLAFFLTSTLNGVSLITFLTLDVILVKHFLSPVAAGEYGLLSLVGKMTYFLGSLFGPFMIPLVSHNEGANKDSRDTFVFLFLITLVSSLASFIGLGVLGEFFVPLVFGPKTLPIVPLLIPYVLSMAVFTISQPIVSFFQAKKNYSFAIVGFFIAVLQISLTSIFHKDLNQVVWVMLITSCVNLLSIGLLYIFKNQVNTVFSNVRDLLGLFAKFRTPKSEKKSGLRILIFNWRDTRHKWAGGAEVYVQELAKRWVESGNSVTIFCGNVGKLPKNEVIDGVQIYRRGGFFMVYVWAVLYYLLKFRGKYDVIIDSENGIPFFTPLYAKERKFLLIHHVHQEVFRKSLKWPGSWLAIFLEAKLMPFVYRNTQVVTVSPSSKAEIKKHKLTNHEPIIIHNGVDLSKFKPGRKSAKPLILYVGRLQYYKSLNIFIRAAKKVLEKYPNAEFIIAGEGGQKKKLLALAEQIGIAGKIKFTGYISNEEKVKLMQKAWVFVNPSFMEGWGITVIEAAASGTPTVASDVPGLRDSIKNNKTGFLVKYADVSGFADLISKLIKDKRLRNDMSSRSVEWAQNYSWVKSSSSFYEVFMANSQLAKNYGGTKNFAYLLNRITSLF